MEVDEADPDRSCLQPWKRLANTVLSVTYSDVSNSASQDTEWQVRPQCFLSTCSSLAATLVD